MGPNPKVVGAARNEFGTRLCKRVQCEKCEKVDYVPVRSKNEFCRDCAEKMFAAFEQGRHIAEREVHRVCGQCRRDFPMRESLAEKKDQVLCPDCFRGFEVWRGKNVRSHHEHRPVLLRMGSRTTFRKNTNDKL